MAVGGERTTADSVGRGGTLDRPWLSTALTVLLVLPAATLTVLYAFQVELVSGFAVRSLIQGAIVAMVPAGLLLLRFLEERQEWANRGRAARWPAIVWALVAVVLIAAPLVARVSLETRRTADGQLTREVHWPAAVELASALLVGLVLASIGFAIGALATRIGSWALIVIAILAVLIGLATVPATLFVLVLSYEVPTTPLDHPLADTFQTMGIVWFVPAPLAAVLAGRSAARLVAHV